MPQDHPGHPDERIDEGRYPGFIALWRKLMQHRYWNDPRMLRAFLYCLLWARHTPGTVRLHGKTRYVPAGAFRTSVRLMADALHEPRSFVARFLADAESNGELRWERRPRRRDGILHIVKFAEYQGVPGESFARELIYLVAHSPGQLFGQLKTLDDAEILGLFDILRRVMRDRFGDTIWDRRGTDVGQVTTTTTKLATTTEVDCRDSHEFIHNCAQAVDNPDAHASGTATPFEAVSRTYIELCKPARQLSQRERQKITEAIDACHGDPASLIAFMRQRVGSMPTNAGGQPLSKSGEPVGSICYLLAAWEREGAATPPDSRTPEPTATVGRPACHELVKPKPPEPMTETESRRGLAALGDILHGLGASRRRGEGEA